MTCWRRLRDWNANGVWQRLAALHQAMLVRLREHDQIDWSRASIDGSSVPSPGGQETGPNPTDRGKLGSKRHLVVDARGIPLVILVSGANRHDSMMFEKCMDAIPAIAGLPGRARKRPAKLHADKGYDYKRCRAYLRRRGIASRIARRGVESSEKLGKHRWVVERTRLMAGLQALASCASALKGGWISTAHC
jgi:transposase